MDKMVQVYPASPLAYTPLAINVGDEGGFAPDISSPEEALDLVREAVKTAGYMSKVKIAMDVAASGKLCWRLPVICFRVFPG